ncbi:MAG: hypothetical protein EPO68_01145 [Planctomycetota bacterium]|nr:MAG: hypothetical protein EPO68_01145 [Planctomycetota bacterium]
MKRLLAAIAVLALVYFAGRAIVRALASEETKIRWALEEMRDGFNDAEPAPVIDHLHPLFREEQSGADLDMAEQALIAVCIGEIDSTTKTFALRAEADFDAWAVELGADDATATAKGDVGLFRSRAGVEKLEWRAKVELELVDDEHEGWLVQRAAFETLEGDRRLR